MGFGGAAPGAAATEFFVRGAGLNGDGILCPLQPPQRRLLMPGVTVDVSSPGDGNAPFRQKIVHCAGLNGANPVPRGTGSKARRPTATFLASGRPASQP